MKILLIDILNDSFIYNLFHYISKFVKKNVDVVRNDKIDGNIFYQKNMIK